MSAATSGFTCLPAYRCAHAGYSLLADQLIPHYLLFKHRNWKDNVGKVVSDRLIAEKSHSRGGVLSQGQLEQLLLIDVDQP
jgi:hypothetical protein